MEIDLGDLNTSLQGIWTPDQGGGMGPYFSLSDGSLVAALVHRWDDPIYVRIVPDPATMEPVRGLYPSGSPGYFYPHGLWNDPLGELWVVYHPGLDGEADNQVGRVGPEGFVPDPVAEMVRAAIPAAEGPLRIQEAHVFENHILVAVCFRSPAENCAPRWLRIPRPGTAPPLEGEEDGDECLPAVCSEYGACTFTTTCAQEGTHERVCRTSTWQSGRCIFQLTTESASCARNVDGEPCDTVCEAFGECIPDGPCTLTGERSRTCAPGSCGGGACNGTGLPYTESEPCTPPDPSGDPCGVGYGAECQDGACVETACDDGVNNDEQGYDDCSDTADCEGMPCDPGDPSRICCWGICSLPANC